MNKKRFVLTLLPSTFSAICVLMLSGLILLVANWSYAAHSGRLYVFLYGSSSSTEVIKTSQGIFSTFNNVVFGNPLLNKVLFFVFWMLIGLIVYILLQGFLRGVAGAAEEVQESRYVNAGKAQGLRWLEIRLATRLCVLAAWILYWVVFIKLLLPYSILTARFGVDTSAGSPVHGWVYALSGFLALALGLHLHVVWLRLLVLRVRIFGTSTE